MKFANLLKQNTAATTAAVINLTTAPAGFFTLAQAIAASELAVGDRTTFLVIDEAGNKEFSLFEITDADTITRVAVRRSTNNDLAENFPNGAVVTNMPDAAWLSQLLSELDGFDLGSAESITSFNAGDYVPIIRGGTILKAPVALVQGNVQAPSDTTAPTLSGAQVSNAAKSDILLTFNETLGAFTPAASAFAVSGGRTVSSVARNGSTITLTVNSPYAYGDAINVTYTKPGANPLQDASGNQTNSFGPSVVANNIAAPGDTVAPVPSSAAVANSTPTTVTVTMSEPMDGNYDPAASAWTVSGHTVSAVDVTGSTVVLTVTPAFVNGEAARVVGYTPPGTNQARDVAGNPLGSISNLAITNNVASAQTMADLYTITNGYTTVPTARSFSGGTAPNQYFGGSFSVYVKDASNNYPAAGTLVFCWSKSATTSPLTWNGSAWAPVLVPYTAGGGTTGDVPNSVKASTYVNEATVPGCFQPASSMFGGGSSGNFYLWVHFPDGSKKSYAVPCAVA